MNSFDVIVIGGGPAGCAMALDLNRRGYNVALCDQAKFPRDKVCGEFISPGADPILEQLGVLGSIEALAPKRLKGVAISSYESAELEIDYPSSSDTGLRPSSLSVPRYQLDALLLNQVQSAGVKVFEQYKVSDFLFDNGSVAGVQGWDENKTSFSLNSKLVVDAGGRNAISLRKFSLKQEPKGNTKIAFSAHWQGVRLPDDYCYMHVSRPGYTGISSVGNDRTNVVLVVDRSALGGEGGEKAEAFYHRVLMKNSRRRNILQGGQRVEPVRSVESLAFSVRPIPCGGLILVGDAMGFIDPFTGEGIYLSLRSSQIAGEVIHAGFQSSNFSRKSLSVYEAKRKEEFGGKFMLSRVLQGLIYNRPFCNWIMKSLSTNQALAETLAGVIGDILPAKKVVSVEFLYQLVVGAFKGNADLKKALD
ncbi:MAG: NAD(P)/FAD-dependent oxidoreductase [Nitrospina sp.]|nr:NAD(P)/FAD-dependent oxidoreductase [Nitrospina sp.]MBT5633015.1 NAD(P)/FAD-dependent oxidoreductase [Nitrospina sp.]